MDKVALLDAFRAQLLARIEEADAGQKQAQAGTRVDGSHRPANRGERAAASSQGYLAAGLGQRIDTMKAHLAALDKLDLSPQEQVSAGSLVQLEHADGATAWWLLVHGGEGLRLGAPGSQARVVSPESPVGQALVGLEVDDDALLPAGGGQEVVVVDIR